MTQEIQFCKNCKHCIYSIGPVPLCASPNNGVNVVSGGSYLKMCSELRKGSPTCPGYEEKLVIKLEPSKPPEIRKETAFTWKSLFKFLKKD